MTYKYNIVDFTKEKKVLSNREVGAWRGTASESFEMRINYCLPDKLVCLSGCYK
jgi:hypothetical protein